ncbi:MAG TPA: Spy/CpxP family protein refolding chaperone [Kofleriaceae bacterium]|nr:Spy/CpxP family protein refolding chaperone [Kofleriaceae bacterium]
MICLAVGLGILGVAAMRRAHRRCHGHCGYGWYGPFGHGYYGPPGPGGRRAWKGRMMLHALFSRIDASPAQERAIIAEFEKLQERVHAAKGGLHEARADLAAALRGPVLDDAALGAVLGRVDSTTGEARAAVIDALRSIHGLLDDKQRAQLADMLEHRGTWWRGGYGPYR